MWNCMRRPLGQDFARGWPDGSGDDRPRVLFESPDGAEAHATWRLLRRHGYQTMWCPGPQGGFSTECPLTATGHCPLVEEADAVVAALDLHDPRCAAVVRGLDAQAPRTPVVVVTPRGAMAQWAEELPHSHVVAGPLSSKVLIRSLSAARAPGEPAPAV